MGPPRVLIVEDEPNIVLSLEFLMKKAGLETEVVRDGRAALARLDGEPADVVILDLMLPGVDGFEILRELRSRPGWSQTRVVVLTARGRQNERERGLELGADDYVTKPFSTRELLERVKALLAGGADG
ncbi:Sensory transduction protein regX3 [bacterium HR39]|nr:Sensory transduction protein regX3 [bacterium HR39]